MRAYFIRMYVRIMACRMLMIFMSKCHVRHSTPVKNPTGIPTTQMARSAQSNVFMAYRPPAPSGSAHMDRRYTE